MIKIRKNSGLSYMTHSGKVKRAKIIKNGCGESCKQKCHSKIGQLEREAIFHEFWGTENYEKQRDFISKTAIDVPVQRV